MSESEPRQRPQYGEYATPEEQRSRIQVPPEQAHKEPVPVPATREPQPGARFGASPATDASRTPLRTADRVATIALLAFGLFNVGTTVPGMLNLSLTLNAAFQQAGIGSYTPTPIANEIGIGIVVLYVAGWLMTAILSALSLRKGRITFWIPLVAGVIIGLVTVVCFIVLLLGDPAFTQYITRNSSLP
ncbi:MAG: hypothetical protein QOF36_1469 [Microbacteriaceae bacterium]|jgi:hypothetical protein|nr:hypothetical protein [Microbacteriaceae bacterium]